MKSHSVRSLDEFNMSKKGPKDGSKALSPYAKKGKTPYKYSFKSDNTPPPPSTGLNELYFALKRKNKRDII